MQNSTIMNQIEIIYAIFVLHNKAIKPHDLHLNYKYSRKMIQCLLMSWIVMNEMSSFN